MINILKEIEGYKVPVKNCCNGTGTGSLPSIEGQSGSLTTDGVNTTWLPTHIEVDSTNFLPDGVTCVVPKYKDQDFSIYYVDNAQYIFKSEGQWQNYADGGFILTVPGLNSNSVFMK